jgi:hypothetical protein
VEPLPEQIYIESGAFRLWCDPAFRESLRFLSGDPDRIFATPGCRIVKDQRKIKVARCPLMIAGEAKSVYIKRYNVFSWRYRAASLVASSPARRAWIGARTLIRHGFLTGAPIAAIETRRWGMLEKSLYVSEEVRHGLTADAYWRDNLVRLEGAAGIRRRRGFLVAVASLFRRLHAAGIYHNDLKDANVVVGGFAPPGPEALYLFDLEGIRTPYRLSFRRRVKNLVQLNRTFGRQLTRTAKLRWLKAYLGKSYARRAERRRWITRVLSESERTNRRKLGTTRSFSG